MSAESPRHVRSGGPLTVPPQPPSDRSIIDAVSGFINDVTLSSSSNPDPKDTIQWARFETADINEPTPEGDNSDISPLLLILGYGSGVQVWLIPPNGEAQEVLSWRQGTVRVLRVLPTPSHGDSFAAKRPLIALCDSASPGPTFCSLSFISIRGGEQVKSIKFKNQILDVLANKRSVVVSFSERFAVFDAGSLEDRMAVTTCYPCPCPLGGSSPINPLALGDRWLAYAEKKINPSKRSSGGCEGEGVTSYTATVLHAAKSLGKGLRGLGESVAQSLAGGRGASPPHPDVNQTGVVSVIDIEGNTEEDNQDSEEPSDPLVAHFIAHSEAIIALKFDASGMLLVTADRRGHDFHVFRINPHPSGPGLAAVHHLYVLHRGDTTAKVQDIAISVDSRWAAVSTLRGTTHVFPLSPYGGAVGVRTHTQPRVVNRLSRFHRSAGLPIHGPQPTRSGSPVGDGLSQGAWFPNPRLPPYPLPTTVTPLAQLRPTANIPTHTITRNSSGRQRLSSLSEEAGPAPLLARAVFGGGATGPRAAAHLALYLITANGCLLHLLLHPRPAKGVAKDKVCDESPVEVEVEAVWQWPLQRPPAAADLLAPLPSNNPLLHTYAARRCADACISEEERWLSQVEIVTHAGPHRRLWMGPQFVFKTYTSTGSSTSLSEAEAVEVETGVSVGAARSTPVNVPPGRPIVPVLIDSGSASSLEQSPSDSCRRKSLLEPGRAVCDVQLKEDLAEAMKEDQEGARTEPCRWEAARGVSRAVDPLGTVVTGHAPAAGRAPPDADLHTRPNDDEARFRPVVRAPAAPPTPRLFVRPLPHHTRIPVQTVPPSAHYLWPDHDHDHLYDAKPDDTEHFKSTYPTEDDDFEERRTDITADPIESKCELRTRDDMFEEQADFPEPEAPPMIVTDDKYRDTYTTGKLKDVDRESIKDKGKKSVLKEESGKEEIRERATKEGSVKREIRERATKEGSVKREITERATKEGSVKRETKKEKKLTQDNEIQREIKIEERTKKEGSVKNEANKEATVKKGKEIRKEEKAAAINAEEEKQHIIDTSVKPEIKSEDNIKHVLQECKVEKEAALIEEEKNLENSSAPEIKERVDHKLPKKENIMKKSKEEVKEQTNDKNIKEKKEEQSIAVTLKLNPKSKEVPKTIPTVDDIKTEEQAWDLLLNETDQNRTISVPHTIVEKIVEEPKIKSKKNKKGKRIIEEAASKSEDDSFVEIHAIEDKPQENSGDLVSISTPFGDLDSTRQLSKRRSPKSTTPERPARKSEDKIEPPCKLSRTPSPAQKSIKPAESDDQIEVLVEPEQSDFNYYNMFDKVHVETPKDGSVSENTSVIKDTIVPKTKKSKSLSPYLDNNRKLSDKLQSSVPKKDLIIIDSSKEQFPEIQITRVSKNRKKSPQAVPQTQEIVEPVVEKPIKSWSSIAASKGSKKADKEINKEETKFDMRNDDMESAAESYSVKDTTLQDKLFEIYKRTDIVVAECDVPSELNFVEEHHKLHDLPPLESLEFGLDDFKIDIMKDSLLEGNNTKVTSPICKINIDDILCSIKESTSKVIESSTFNLVDLEKVSVKREMGYNFVENEKITSQEVDIKMSDDKQDEKESEMMEKSSDDDNTSPVLSTDSDKEEKKAGAASAVQPSPKQTAKAKKSRRKKK